MKLLTAISLLALTFSAIASGGSYNPNNLKHTKKVYKACADGNTKELNKWERKGWDIFDQQTFGYIDAPNNSNNPLFGMAFGLKDFNAYENCITYLVNRGADVHEKFKYTGFGIPLRKANLGAYHVLSNHEEASVPLVVALAKNGMDINETLYSDDGSRTNVAILAIVKNYTLWGIKNLVEKGGADVLAFGKERPVRLARQTGKHDLADYIEKLAEERGITE